MIGRLPIGRTLVRSGRPCFSTRGLSHYWTAAAGSVGPIARRGVNEDLGEHVLTPDVRATLDDPLVRVFAHPIDQARMRRRPDRPSTSNAKPRFRTIGIETVAGRAPGLLGLCHSVGL